MVVDILAQCSRHFYGFENCRSFELGEHEKLQDPNMVVPLFFCISAMFRLLKISIVRQV